MLRYDVFYVYYSFSLSKDLHKAASSHIFLNLSRAGRAGDLEDCVVVVGVNLNLICYFRVLKVVTWHFMSC